MNRIYTTVWSHTISAWTVVSETARSRGKRGATRLAGALLLAPVAALAQLPTGGSIVAGQGSLNQAGNTLTVNQGSDKLAIDWQSFSIGQGHSVNFVQPGAASVALNRVLGPEVSVIQGALNANGQVFLVNPNGVLFSPTAQVNVGSLVASTLDIRTEDFLAGRYEFSGTSLAAVQNQGGLNAAGGHVALIAAKIVNNGTITADHGSVVLAAGSRVTLDLGGPVAVEVDGGALGALIDNGGAIRADAGTVLLSARGLGGLTSTVINHSGVIEARSLGLGADGVVSLLGEQGAVAVSGRIDVSSAQGQGGTATVTGDAVTLTSGAAIDATGATGGGAIYVGGGWQGQGGIKQATHTTIEAGATLDASATVNGQGGTVVAWSDVKKDEGRTEVAGTLKARGGAQGGDGGRIETSGATLAVRGAPDASAPHGKGGLWLIDPTDVTVAAGAGAIGSATVGFDDIEAALAGGTNVSILADNSITWNGNYTNTGGSGRTLALSADELLLNGNLSSTSDLSYIFNGDVKLVNDITITSQGGEIYFAKFVDSAQAGPANARRLTLNNSGTGSVIFGDQVGGTNALASLYVTTDATGSTQINGGVVRTVGEQVYDSPVVLGAAEFLNADFENGTVGWSITDARVYLNGGSVIRGYATPNDPLGPPGTDAGENVPSSGSFSSNVGAGGADGTNGLRLSSNQSCNTGFCVVRGGYVTSDSTIALAKGDQVSFQWNAAGSSDAYDVFGYLLNVKTGETQVILNATGANSWSSTGWQTASVTVDTAGTYAFVFVSGSWDASGGMALGATLTLDNISTASLLNGKTLEGSSLSFLKGLNAADNKLTLKADQIDFGGSTVSGTGQIGFEARTPTDRIEVGGAAGAPVAGKLNLSADLLASLADGFSSINIGGADTQGDIVIVANTRLQDDVVLNAGSGNIRLDAGLASDGAGGAGTGMVTLRTDGGTATQASGAAIDAGTLALVGNGGRFTLDNPANSVDTLVATTQDISLRNSGALTIGSATLADGSTVNGIHNTGLVNVATGSGDLTLAKSVTTGSNASNAIVLNAGAGQSAGQASGGDVRVGAGSTVSTGAGGRAVIYTGSLAGSTGVTNAVGGGTGRFRYNSDESVSNFGLALGQSGLHAVYREQPVVTLSTNANTKREAEGSGQAGFDGGGAAGFDVLSGLVNGDTKAMLGDPRYYTDAAGPGEHAIRIDLANALGYAVVNSPANAKVDVKMVFDPSTFMESVQLPTFKAPTIHAVSLPDTGSVPTAGGGLRLVALPATAEQTTESSDATADGNNACASGWIGGAGCGGSAEVLVGGAGLRLPTAP
ncbi:filamentous hemagglutinin N-terminal domain-containing protein [uncultured Hydrogenophaga sp.]|uniref:two-partner secretion domain-containing protein n=1 Tax=uncultured Hydrogenophaga sp. TaxID=199683 RepID=UPI002586DC8A|nr:filamentous hemagglutinin N-terminal domain-containing protein [uncultured Hydrogenophaga sp.]